MTVDDTTRDFPVSTALGAVRRQLRRRRLVAACLRFPAALALFLLAARSAQFAFGLREAGAFAWLVVALAAGTAALAAGVATCLLRFPRPRDLALEIESAHPELLDALVCAAEVEGIPPASRRPLQRALLEKAAADLHRAGGYRDVFADRLRLRRILVPALVVGMACGLLLRSAPFLKALHFGRDLLAGESTGLVLTVPTEPVPEHSNVRVEVDIRRWEKRAEIVYEDADGRHRFPMNDAESGSKFFTFYDVTRPIRFRVVTPSLASRRYTLEPFAPPVFRAVRLEAVPPAYTRLEPQSREGFGDITAPAGSELRIRVETDPGVNGTLAGEGVHAPFDASGGGILTLSLVPATGFSARVELRNPEGRMAPGPEFAFIAEPDLPPVIDMVQPRKDVSVSATATVPCEARATDDYGLSRIEVLWSVSGGERRTEVLYASPGSAADGARPELPRDRTVSFDIRPGDMGASEGDVIAYSFVAADNREPQAQVARTDVFFVVVRPDMDAAEQEGEGGEQKKLDISGLIAEMKRLIRFSWDAAPLGPADRVEPAATLARELRDLELETRKKLNEVRELSGGRAEETIETCFIDAGAEIARAAGLADRELVEESISPQERALAHLVRLENELMMNAAKGKGGGESEEQPSDSEQTAQPEESGTPEQVPEGERLKEALEQTRRLAERQDRLNRNLAGLPENAAAEAQRGAEDQRDILDGAEAVRRALGNLESAERAAADLAQAGSEMSRGADALDRGESRAGTRHGERAGAGLQAAMRSLEEAVRAEAANRMNRLARIAAALAAEEGRAAGRSRELAGDENPTEEAAEAERVRQDSLRDTAKLLGEATERLSAELEDVNPEASRALADAVRKTRDSGLDRALGRAVNALLYRRFPKAAEEQDRAAGILSEAAGDIEAASRLFPGLTQEDLMEMLQALEDAGREARRESQSESPESGEKLARLGRETGARLGSVAKALGQEELARLAEAMGNLGEGLSNAEAGERLAGAFDAASAILRQTVLASELRRTLSLSRQLAEPPERYRSLVEQYFKDLSRE